MKSYRHYPKIKEAVALGGQLDDGNAPVVLAKGKGVTAEKILEAAKESGIPVQQDAALVELLGQLDLNETIPEELFEAVAEVFAFIYRLDQKVGESKK
ncbi:type III secretion system protein [Siminovitchia acidinfaciens]|uniref:Type III secretion system protein n=1 Tax=Siminovitchia acidinfaciens TaxID=2321395 RepID=A0A429Y2J4_9BACI|nr:EscU/YscU/HrcU family type III secretion system export apparatus switch protein [Siminovitchia acidinfaciens]RST75473.1 type III secretion system protein [Siminovitchia acidinfaciens]